MEHINFTDALRILILQHAGTAYRTGRTVFRSDEIILRMTYAHLLDLDVTHSIPTPILAERTTRCFLEVDAQYSQQEALDLAEAMVAEYWGPFPTNAT